MRTGLARLLGAHSPQRASVWWLGQLPAGWHLVYDVPVGESGTIDHMIVGPAGVFAVNAKDVTGQVWVGASGIRINGHATDDVWRLVRGAQSAARLLSAELEHVVSVHPVLTILADGWTIQEAPSDVFIGPPRIVKDRLLRRLPTTLSTLEVTAITAAAARLSTLDETS